MNARLSFVVTISLAALSGCSDGRKAEADAKAATAAQARAAAEAEAAVAKAAQAKAEAELAKLKAETELAKAKANARPIKPKDNNKTVEDARAEFQRRIDRFLGGQRDPKLLGGTFPIAAIVTVFDNIQIENVLQKYDASGNIVPNEFVATFKASGADKHTGEPQRPRTFQPDEFGFRGGKWHVQ